MMSDNGYPLEWFVESLDAYLICGICGQVLRDPRVTVCGHVFCHRCLALWIDEYGICPARCGEVELESLRRASHISKKISCLLTRCQYTKVGCKAILQLSDKETHERKCHYAKKVVGKTRSFPFFNLGTASLSQQQDEHRPQLKSSRSVHHRSQLVRSSASDGAGEKDRRSTLHSSRSQLSKHRRTHSAGFGFGGIKLLSKKAPSVSGVNLKKIPSVSKAKPSAPKIPKPMKMQSQHTYRLKRTKPKESLGLVLVSGEKTPDGRPISFYVKDVNPDTLAARAGMKAGDRIVQVDYLNLTNIAPQESVARIKDKPIVTLTVLRGVVSSSSSKQKSSTQDHIYDEIMYADQQLSQNLSQQDDFSQFTTGFSQDPFPGSHRPRHGQLTERELLRHEIRTRACSPNGTKDLHHINYPTVSTHDTQVTIPGEKGSKDSGLSSGSSNSPEHQKDRLKMFENQGVVYPEDAPFDRIANMRHSYRTEREMLKKFLKSRKKEPDNVVETEKTGEERKNCRIEGDYEVEEIYLQKSGTSQLGVTLGYDTKTAKGHLYVCEILPTGLAYQDGRLKCGDIIRRVNGFEVYDPEEAILLFLEQDQDITLTVARKIKPVSNRLILTNQTTVQPAIEHTYAVLEEKVTGSSTPLRRIDSCGSLDSRSHKYARGHNKAAQLEDDTEHVYNTTSTKTASMIKMNEAGYEYMQGRSSNHTPPDQPPHQLSVATTRSSSRSPPRNFSPLCYSTSASHLPRSTSPYSTLSQNSGGVSAHHTPSPPRNTPSPEANIRVQSRPTSLDHLSPTTVTPSKVLSPSSLPDSSYRGPRMNHEHKVLHTSNSADGLRKAKSFRTINEVNSCKLATRCDSNDFVFNRSESLV